MRLFPYYFGGILNLIGLSPLLATKIMIAVGIIFSTASKFAGKDFWGRDGWTYFCDSLSALSLPCSGYLCQGDIGRLGICIYSFNLLRVMETYKGAKNKIYLVLGLYHALA